MSAKQGDFGVHGRSTGGEEAATQRQHWRCSGNWRCPGKRHLAAAVATERDRWGRESMGLVVQVGGLGSLNVSGGQRDWPEVLEMMRLKMPLRTCPACSMRAKVVVAGWFGGARPATTS